MGTDVHAVFQTPRDGKWEAIESKWEQDRHYLLFSWLADVRNGYGFAGVKTYEPVKPIAGPRGLPADFDKDAYEGNDADGPYLGDHSFSWLTADEILAAPRPGTVKRTGVVPRAFYDAWDGKTPPSEWSGSISGRDIVVATAPNVPEHATHVQIEWESPDDGLDYFVDEIKRLQAEHGQVRMVFGFDS